MRSVFAIVLLLLAGGVVYAGGGDKSFSRAQMDTSVAAAADFYAYANGTWLKNNPIPDEYTRWGSFEMLTEENFTVLKAILEQLAANTTATKGSIEQLVGGLYFSGMDSAAIEQAGFAPLKPAYDAINAINGPVDVIRTIGNMHKYGTGSLFAFFAAEDPKNSSQYLAQLYQGGLGMPDRDYYLKDDKRSTELRGKYVAHIANLFVLAGETRVQAEAIAARLLQFETRLAKASMSRVEMRDPNKTYNKWAMGAVTDSTKGLDWNTYFSAIGITAPAEINIAQPAFAREIAAMLSNEPVAVWKEYLRWNLLRSNANYLSSAFVNERFEFAGKALSGAKTLQPRWKRILQVINGELGEALGKLYVEKAFPPEAKEKALTIVKNLLVAMGEHIDALDWMSPETKKAAHTKLSTFMVKIGYPDKWTDYSSVAINRNNFFENIRATNQFGFRENMDKIGKPVDRLEWGMNPQTVNAYYNPSKNEIVFPAAILQPPFYDPKADDALNYGAMGVVIGHEITHGFDDEGRKFDANGNLTDWWTKEDGEKFEQRLALIVSQYNSYMPIDTNRVNGELTAGENIADLGGLSISFTAFKKTNQYKNNITVDGLTPAQRFYLSYANVWKNNIRPEALMMRLKTDPHSPGKYRTIGPLSNIRDFWDAFAIPEGAPMRNTGSKLVKIW